MARTIVLVSAYMLVILAANAALQAFGLVSVGFGLLAPAGVFFVGIGFTLRDLIQRHAGSGAVLVAITGGTLLSALVSPAFALASGTAFLLSELADFAVYTPLQQRGLLWAIVLSNIVGLVVDSVLFLWLAFGSLEFLPGQIVGKAAMTLLVVLIYAAWFTVRPRPVAA